MTVAKIPLRRDLGSTIKMLRQPGKFAGFGAFLLHRITGLFLVAYIFFHVYEISKIQWANESFDELIATLQTPLWLLFDVGLVAVVAIHSLNGIRITLFDLGLGITRQKELFWLMMAIAIVITIAAFLFVWPHLGFGGGGGG